MDLYMPLATSERKREVAVCAGGNLATHNLGAYPGYYKQDFGRHIVPLRRPLRGEHQVYVA
jgi:hypothetical protein